MVCPSCASLLATAPASARAVRGPLFLAPAACRAAAAFIPAFLFGCLLKLHGQADPLFFQLHPQDLHLYDIAYAHHLQRMLDEPVCHLRDMDQAVLMDPDIHKRAEIDHVPDGAL